MEKINMKEELEEQLLKEENEIDSLRRLLEEKERVAEELKLEKAKVEQQEQVEHQNQELVNIVKDKKTKILESNLAYLATVDIETYINEIKKENIMLRNLIADLIDLMTLDDAIVTTLQKVGDEITWEEIEDVKSIVQTWNDNGYFKTLASYDGSRENLLKELLGESKYNSKLKRSKKTILKNSKQKLN